MMNTKKRIQKVWTLVCKDLNDAGGKRSFLRKKIIETVKNNMHFFPRNSMH